MIPTTYSHSLSSIMTPLHLNNEVHNHHHHHHLFNPNHQPPSSSFSSPSSYPILYNPPNHDLQGSYCWELNHFPSDHQETGKIIPSSGSSWEHSEAENHESSIGSKVRVWNEDKGENLQEAEDDAEDGSMKWMPSKMRIMRKMMGLDETRGSYVASGSSMHKFEHEKQPLFSPLGIDNSSKNNYPIQSTNSNTVRICSDCHTTKTPLWRSGPRGPKSLCNACGIRQRKARRAMAAAAANGRVVMAAEKSVKGKEKKSKTEFASPKMKKKQKIIISKPSSQTTNKFSFEDLTLRLSKNVAFKQVFPQDEKEAAILLMALSYGFVHR